MARHVVTAEDVVRWRSATRAGVPGEKIRGAEDPEPVSHSDVDGYFGRLLKYIPAEVVGLYLAAQGIVRSAEGEGATAALWVTFVVCLILTPLYLRRNNVRRLPELTVSTIAFPVWVFAIGGPFEDLAIYRPWIASLVLLLYASVAALMVPKGPAA